MPRRSASPTAGRGRRALTERALAGRAERLRRRQRRSVPEPTEPGLAAGAPAASGSSVAPREGAPADRSRASASWLWRSLTRPGRGQVIAAVILFVVGLAGVTQVRINSADSTYTNARREDLVLLLDGLSEESRRLQSEIADLERTRSGLQSGADTSRLAREEAERRASELAILAGTAAAEGPGIRMRIADPRGLVTADILLDAVEEMRDAGAEVIEVNDTVRVVASTWFGSTAEDLVVDGVPVRPPYVLEVIGEPHALEEAAQFRGGIVSEITGPRIGGQVEITSPNRVVVESLHTPRDNQYAQPASPAPTPR